MAFRFPVHNGLDATLRSDQFPHAMFDHDVGNRMRSIFLQIWGRPTGAGKSIIWCVDWCLLLSIDCVSSSVYYNTINNSTQHNITKQQQQHHPSMLSTKSRCIYLMVGIRNMFIIVNKINVVDLSVDYVVLIQPRLLLWNGGMETTCWQTHC